MTPSPKLITELAANEIFVFGSNLSGIHGAGAAYTAHKQFGAEWAVVEGMTGQCYAIPTKARNVWASLSLDRIGASIERFLKVAAATPDKIFLVTEIGCGYAGYEPKDIAPLFHDNEIPANVRLPERFIL